MAQPTVHPTQVNPQIPFKKNAIINGNFDIWQRGISFIGTVGAFYSADRWLRSTSGTMIVDIVRSNNFLPTVAQSGRLFNFAIALIVATADASIAAGDFTILTQRIEGNNFVPIAQQPMILSFWVKSSDVTGIFCISLRNSGFNRSYVAEYTINALDTWEYKTILIPASPSAGTWNYTTGIGLDVSFTLASGTTFHTTPNAWQTGNFIATANQVNAVGLVGPTEVFQVTGVQLERGSVATEIEQRTFNEELMLCQRYYEKSYDVDAIPGSITSVGAMTGEAEGNTQSNLHRAFAVVKRNTPTETWYNPVTGAIDSLNGTSADFAISGTSYTGNSSVGVPITISSLATTEDLRVHFTADAEL